MNCPYCNAVGATKYDRIGDGRQRMLCSSSLCGRIFVLEPRRPRVSPEAKQIAADLAGQVGKTLTAEILAKATGLSERTIYTYKAKQGEAGA